MAKTTLSLLGLVTWLSFMPTASASVSGSTTINDITVHGQKRLDSETIKNYLPIHVGEHYRSSESPKLLEGLYATGLFKQITLNFANSILDVQVIERPVISQIQIHGNHKVERKKIEEILSSKEIARGQTANPVKLNEAKTMIQQEYLNRGFYNAQIVITWVTQPSGTVILKLQVHEGSLAKVKKIHIIGNQAFSEGTLVDELHLGASTWSSFFTNNDRFSDYYLHADQEALRGYYLDRGYIQFHLNQTQVTTTEDHRGLFITYMISEGERFRLGEIELTGDFPVPRDELEKLIKIKSGQWFSRQALQETTAAISTYLGDRGYAFAHVEIKPETDETTHQVKIVLNVIPGKKVYVRRIDFTGNAKSQDEVLRREVIQKEGEQISLTNVQESARHLRLLNYFKEVKVSTTQVPGFDDQLDLGFSVIESPYAKATAAVGYGTDGFVFQLGFNQENFLGSGKTIGFDFSNDRLNQVFSLYYDNPYYTPNGVSRGFSLYAEKITPGRVNAASYTSNQYGASVNYGVPLSPDNRLNFGYGFDHTDLTMGDYAAFELKQFEMKYGRHFDQIILTGGWNYNGLDQALMPTKGLWQGISAMVSAPVASNSLDYYKVNYKAQYYQPLIADFILLMRANLGYGDGYGHQDELPFLKNYFAGGIGSVRGYASNSLGPRDSLGDALGGNLLMSGSVGLIVPQPFSEDLRAILFLDAGNVFNTHSDVVRKTRADFINNNHISEGKFDLGEIRLSAGLELDWRSPLGPLIFNLGAPINARSGDEREVFQFTIGTSF